MIKNNENIFITGTNTDIGKTFISSLLCKFLNYKYHKPIQTGLETDTDFVKNFDSNIEIIPNTYHFNAPLSPNVSASLEGKTIDFDRVCNNCKNLESTIIEGAGGILVPINENKFILDIPKELNLKTIVVTNDILGTINHTLMTLQILKQHNINILGFVMNNYVNDSNLENIEKYSNIKCIGKVKKSSINNTNSKELFNF